MFIESIERLVNLRIKRNIEEKELFLDIAKAYMSKWNTDTIYFDTDADCPNYDYVGGSGDSNDAQIKKITFCPNGEIKEMEAHLYYEYEDVLGDTTEFYGVDYLELAEFIYTQMEDRYIPEEDE